MNSEDPSPWPNAFSVAPPVQTTYRLIALGALVVLGMLMAGATVLFDAREDAWRQSELSSSNLIGSIERDIKHVINVYDRSIQSLVGIMEGTRGEELTSSALQVELSDRAALAEYVGTMFVADAEGNIIATSVGQDFPANVANEDFFQRQRDAKPDGLILSRPFRSYSDGHDVRMALSRRINKPNGSFGGVVVGSLRFAYFEDMFSSLGLGPNGTAFMMRDDARLIARFPSAGVTLDADMHDSPVWLGMRSAEGGQFVATSKVDGIERLIAFRRVTGLPLRVTVAVSVDEVLSAWRHKAFVIGPILFALACGTMMLCVLFQREMARRLRVEHQLVEAARDLTIAASTDHLTGLANRRAYQIKLSMAWQESVRNRNSIAMLLADADFFKVYNDKYGHQAGDAVLKKIAMCLGTHSHPGIHVARHGGEEFAVILPNVDVKEAVNLAERMRLAVSALNIAHVGSPSGRVTISIGVAVFRPAESDSEILLFNRADEALYNAKDQGRNRVSTLGSESTINISDLTKMAS